jgi:hypothetical protein
MALKQRRIKPSRDYSYAEAIVVQAGATIAENNLIYISGFTGATMVALPAQADGNDYEYGDVLFVAKHDIPSGAQGVALPWRVITVDTSAYSVDDLVYLSVTGGAYSAAPGVGSLVQRPVGRVLTSDATTGKLLLAPQAFANHPLATGMLNIDKTPVVPQIVPVAIVANTTSTFTVPFDATIVDLVMLVTTGSTTENLVLTNDGNTVFTLATGTVIPDALVRAATIDGTYAGYTAGDNMTLALGSTIAGIAYLTVLPS